MRPDISLQIYVMFEVVDIKDTAWFALALAGVYIFLSRRTRARATSAGSGTEG